MTRRFHKILQFSGLLILAGAMTIVFGQTPANDDVRNVFLKGRESYENPPVNTEATNSSTVGFGNKKVRNRGFDPNAEIVKRENKSEPRSKDEPSSVRRPSSPSTPTPAPTRMPLPNPGQNLALGYTLYKQDAGQWMRVDPTQTFRSGDKVRFTLETSVPGYLYVVQREAEDGAAILLFPHPKLANGNNYMEAHRLLPMPSSQNASEQWLDIEGNAGIETLYFIFSRKPLPMIPSREMLVAYCQEEPKECTKLKPFVWNWLAARQNRPTLTMTNPMYGQKLMPEEVTSIKHGTRLKPKMILPAVMTMLANKSSDPDEDLIITKVSLTHK